MIKKIFSILLIGVLIFNFNITTSAVTEEFDEFTELKETETAKYESIMINPDGEVIYTPYDNYESLPQSQIISESKAYPINRNLSALSVAPSYTSALGVSSTKANARSESTIGINYMYVYVEAFYPQGKSIGTKTVANPNGTFAVIMSALVEIPANPWGHIIGSAASNHYYKHTGYIDVNHNLSFPN